MRGARQNGAPGEAHFTGNPAAKMQTLGVNIAQDAISNIEAGRRLVMDYELRAFATVLQVPIEELLEPEEE